MLPKLSHPTFETTIPSTGEKIKFRPFLVKEHKTLMKAVEFNDQTNLIETFKNLVSECTFGAVDVYKLAMFDVEFLYLKIKGSSTGSINPVRYKCNGEVDGQPCGQVITMNLDTEQAVVNVPDTNKTIVIDEVNGIGIKLKYPSFEDYMRRGSDKDIIELSEEFVLDCVDVVFDKDTVYLPGKDYTRDELRSFIDEMDEKSADLITEFVNNIPQVEMSVKIRCPKCGNEDELHLRGLGDFLE